MAGLRLCPVSHRVWLVPPVVGSARARHRRYAPVPLLRLCMCISSSVVLPVAQAQLLGALDLDDDTVLDDHVDAAEAQAAQRIADTRDGVRYGALFLNCHRRFNQWMSHLAFSFCARKPRFQIWKSCTKTRTRFGNTNTWSPACKPRAAWRSWVISTFNGRPKSGASSSTFTDAPAALMRWTCAFRLDVPRGMRSISSSCGRT